MNVNVDIEIIDDLPIDKINSYKELVIYGIARNTLDYTLANNRFPYLSGELQRSAVAEGVRQESKYTFYLGAEGTDYAEYVWQMPQETTNWTNPDTYSQWYIRTFKDKKEIITRNAIDNAIRSVK